MPQKLAWKINFYERTENFPKSLEKSIFLCYTKIYSACERQKNYDRAMFGLSVALRNIILMTE